ncbi:feline leukemia virus subgroup C receptor-related protein 2-like [Melanaphis sacchari]|uniref:Choline/ethanolamine transporter FLVCR1 n=1 Tax=Melanaphis sacchari TaxID=742174 RepID=A0A2H8TT86_9HEMI|nr:feline leukemia virus subgroup C receptor-related protein 2-like [Melanaphis sacchari]XP_025196975.1 feline leukemia virus subgroup C receptor-related protein 2-like [Melanaphis sacchari]XP_025196976.1 feline leukemia virus subgroup C receptor-related protein 2-like [Melanaphis sacchari]XP_025196977.1 feline leukemia virus subgroup C receptor-related protein 2-like [Melanaphis sacchari]
MDCGVTGNNNLQPIITECKLYKRRWLMLVLFVLCSMISAVQWIQYSIISNVIMKFYKVSSFTVDFTSIVYMVTYIPLIFPASWILEKKGLRVAMVAGSFGTMIGAWFKVASSSPDRFYMTMLGQTIVASSQVFILNLPARLAAVWFGPSEVSTACSIGVFGNQFGIALGFLIPPLLVQDSDDLYDISSGLSKMYYATAITSTLVFLLICLFVKSSPPLPPSLAQANQRSTYNNDPRNFIKSLWRLIYNYGFLLLLLSYGMNVGSSYAISTLLNQVILAHFPDNAVDVGRIGLSIVLSGMLGSVVSGFVLDRTHLFKETTLVVYGCSLIGMLVYTYTLFCGYISVVYLSAILLGFFMNGYLAIGYELAAELTYPESEGTSSGMLNAVVQVFGIIFTMVYGWIFNAVGDKRANLFLSATLIVGTFLTAMIPSDLRRQAAQEKKSLVN